MLKPNPSGNRFPAAVAVTLAASVLIVVTALAQALTNVQSFF